MMTVPPGRRSARLSLSAAGFMATSTSGWSPAVRMSKSAIWTWNDDTPGSVPAGRPDLGREAGEGGEVVAEYGRVVGEPVPGDLHPVAGVAGETDHYPVERLLV